ncbi:MAG: hypothetical protein NUV91_10075 [Candidatus Omnitrophica bacterium]|nr:hypothetical protein [Candidatus Omnitrophota bacterium]
MFVLLIGDDDDKKRAKITEIKKKLFTSSDAAKFDCEILSAHKLSAENLKKALLTLPAVASRRLVILQDCQKCAPALEEILFTTLESLPKHLALILDATHLSEKEKVLSKIRSQVQVVEFPRAKEANVFDMTQAMVARKSAEALKILNDLFSNGIHPLQIMGGLVWFWSNRCQVFGVKNFEKGLEILQEADGNIKRSRLKPEMALELAVVKLCKIMENRG